MSSPVRYQPVAQSPVPQTNISQTTAIEQSRAVAEVQAAVYVAQQRPRNKSVAVEEMRDATAQMAVAQKAYFRFRRGGDQVTGPTIHLARELARCWGNIDYGIKELRRDDDGSEMLAHAWDLQTNARSTTTFIVPHVRDTKQGTKKLVDVRDIYENNANAGSRRLREMIFNVLPSWFTEEAKANCDATLENGGGKPIAQRIADAIKGFESIGVNRAQLDAKIGRASNEWNGHDLGQLSTIYQSIKRGEVSRDDEFAQATSVTAAAIVNAQPDPVPSATTTPADAVIDDESVAIGLAAEAAAKAEAPNTSERAAPATRVTADKPTVEQLEALAEVLANEGHDTTPKKVAFLSKEVGRKITLPNQLTPDEVDNIVGGLRTEQARDAATKGGAQTGDAK